MAVAAAEAVVVGAAANLEGARTFALTRALCREQAVMRPQMQQIRDVFLLRVGHHIGSRAAAHPAAHTSVKLGLVGGMHS